jgi:glycosyltransferase involved in cell wall biosynthesis
VSVAAGRVALVHDWLTGMRGGEKVLERLCALHPEAPLYTLVWNPGKVSLAIESHEIRTSFLQSMPGAASHYRWYLPLFPRAISGFDLSAYDVVISSSHAVAKGVRVRPGAFHLSYLHTPMRYVWDLETQYFPPGRFPWPLSWYVRSTCARLRRWDVASNQGVHAMVANSAHVAERIRRHYGREAVVVHPPVDIRRFEVAGEGPRDYYLLAGALAPYKRGELAIEACRSLGRRLVVVGSGPMERVLRRAARADVEFRGWVSDDEMARLYQRARALLFPGEEDFGIVPVEAQACGRPVVALSRGGALETVTDGETGVLVAEPTAESLGEGLRRVGSLSFDSSRIRASAERFSKDRHATAMRAVIADTLAAPVGTRW